MSEKPTIIAELYEMKVKDFMEPIDINDSSVEKSDHIEHIFHLLEKKNHLWVVNDKKDLQLLGVITESDAIQLFAPSYPTLSFDIPKLQSFQYGLTIVAEEIMSPQPITAKPDETIVDVILKMKHHKIKQLPVIEENKQLVGEIRLKRLIYEYSKRQRENTKLETTNRP